MLFPTVTCLGAEFVPAFISAGRLTGWLGQDPVPPFAAMPHIVVPPDQVDAWISAYAEPFSIKS